MTVDALTQPHHLLSLAWNDTQQHGSWFAPLVTTSAGLLCLLLYLCSSGRRSELPVFNPKTWWELTTMRAKRDFDANAPSWIESWFSQNDKPIRFIVDSGYCTILPSSMADEFRKMKELCMYKFLGTVRSPPFFATASAVRTRLTDLCALIRTFTLIFLDSMDSRKSRGMHISSPKWS